MQSYIDEITTASYEVVRLSATTSTILERRFAATVIEQGALTIAGRPGYFATVDVANLDEIKVSPEARSRRVQLVLFRAPNDETLPEEPIASKKAAARSFPVLIVAGYSNLPPDFNQELQVFHDFLGRLTIAGQSGLSIAPSPPPLPPPAPTTAATL
jgi:hypothetical protein